MNIPKNFPLSSIGDATYNIDLQTRYNRFDMMFNGLAIYPQDWSGMGSTRIIRKG